MVRCSWCFLSEMHIIAGVISYVNIPCYVYVFGASSYISMRIMQICDFSLFMNGCISRIIVNVLLHNIRICLDA